MFLDQYLKKSSQTQAEFGAKLKPPVTQGTVGHWTKGRVMVGTEYAVQIEDLSAGDVTPKDLVDMFHAGQEQLKAAATTAEDAARAPAAAGA